MGTGKRSGPRPLGDESGPDITTTPTSYVINISRPRARDIRSRLVDPWSNFSCVVKRDKELLARNVLWRCGSFQE